MRFALAVALSTALHVLVLVIVGNTMLVETSSKPDNGPELRVCSMSLSTSDCEEERKPSVQVSTALPAIEVVAPEAVDSERPMVEVRAMVVPPKCQVGQVPEPPAAVVPMPEMRTAPRQARIEARLRDESQICPDYPRGARRRGEQGTVVLSLDVDAFGTVISAKVVSTAGYEALDAAAIKAALAAKFVPARVDGRPVSSTILLPLVFSLQ